MELLAAILRRDGEALAILAAQRGLPEANLPSRLGCAPHGPGQAPKQLKTAQRPACATSPRTWRRRRRRSVTGPDRELLLRNPVVKTVQPPPLHWQGWRRELVLRAAAACPAAAPARRSAWHRFTADPRQARGYAFYGGQRSGTCRDRPERRCWLALAKPQASM